MGSMKTTSYMNPLKVKQVLNSFDIFVMTTKSTQDVNSSVVGHGLPTAKAFFATDPPVVGLVYADPPVVGHVNTDV